MARQHPLVADVEAGLVGGYERFADLSADESATVIHHLLSSPGGRRWLRSNPGLPTDVADLLLAHSSDFRQQRRDRTLTSTVDRASLKAILENVVTIAISPAASALWQRLKSDPAVLITTAMRLVAGTDEHAAGSTLHLLVLDPMDPYSLGSDRRCRIATGALGSPYANVRGLAAEFLDATDPAPLVTDLERLIADESQRVRGVVWGAALRIARTEAVDLASALLSDETSPVPARRSALIALGAALPTGQLAELLAYFVVHPNHELASDAAELLFRQHRNPLTATAARESPHADVREIAEQLLDPLRGSPAAGGSRPGDPSRSSRDIYADVIRQLEQATENQKEPPQR